MFLLDSSGSIKKDPHGWSKVLGFAQSLVRNLDIGRDAVRVGVALFSRWTALHIRMNQYYSKGQLINHIGRLPYMDSFTNTPDAIKRVANEYFQSWNGDRSDAKNLVIFMTDGVPNLRNEEKDHVRMMSQWTIGNATQAKNKGITFYSVGVALNRPDASEGSKLYAMSTLKGVASDPENVFNIDSFDGFNSILPSLQYRISHDCAGPRPTLWPKTCKNFTIPVWAVFVFSIAFVVCKSCRVCMGKNWQLLQKSLFVV